MMQFDATAYGPLITPLLTPGRLPALGPGQPNLAAKPHLQALKPESIGVPTGDRDMARACIAGLWLLHDFLDESHAISQDLPSSTGSYWHAVMHRREPDAANSKYWWHRVGAHPVLELVKSDASSIGYSYRNAEEFVDFCERARGSGSAEEDLGKKIQLLEWKLLFDWCWNKANIVVRT